VTLGCTTLTEETNVNDALPENVSAALYQAALDNLPHPVLIYDAEKILYANEAACQALCGACTSRLRGMGVDNFTLPDLADVNDARRSYVMDQGVALSNLMVKIRKLDGECAVLRVDIRPISFNGTTAALATLAQH
jgi:PAS domain S-box-containing protein